MNFDQGAVLIENRDGAGNADVDADDHFLLPTASLKRAWPNTASRQKPPESPEPIGSTSRRLTSRQFPLRDKIYLAALTAALPVNTRMETVAYSTRAANYETAARLPRKRIVAIFLTSCFVLYLIKFNLLKSTFREAIMQNNHSNGSCASFARGFAAFWAVLAMGLGLIASPAEAAPFAYVANSGSNNVSVIDTATNKAVATVVPVGHNPQGIAVTPDGTHAYVTNISDNTVSVIDTASNTVVATVLVGYVPQLVAVTPDGKHVYVPNVGSNNVSVIDTAGNTVVATVPVGGGPVRVAVTPDGNHVYVPNVFSNTVSVIDTASNTVVATALVGMGPERVAVTPDGKRAYVTNVSSNTVSVIDTASNTVVATVPVGLGPFWVAVTPDGKHVYVPNISSNNVSVIDTASNTVVATVTVPQGAGLVAIAPDGKHAYVASSGVSVIDTASNTVVATILVAPQSVAVTPDGEHVYVTNAGSIDVNGTVAVIAAATNTVVATVPMGNVPAGVAIVPPPPGVPFLAFSATLAIDVDAPKQDAFNLQSQFTCSTVNINPVTAAVKLQVGTFTTTIPPGSFKKQPDGSFTFAAEIGGVTLTALIKPTGTKRYAFNASATRASLTGTKNPVYVTLIIGDDSGATSVNAHISR
jgi:YVTN family beta-propeller protein